MASGAYIIERNGLGIVRMTQGKKVFWRIMHVASGLEVSGKIGYDHKGRWKLAEVKAAFNALADAFPWNEWTAENPPEWANEAYKAVRAQERVAFYNGVTPYEELNNGY